MYSKDYNGGRKLEGELRNARKERATKGEKELWLSSKHLEKKM